LLTARQIKRGSLQLVFYLIPEVHLPQGTFDPIIQK